MTDPPPHDKITTTVRLPRDLHRRVTTAAADDLRSFNNEVIALLESGLAHRDAKAAHR